MKMKIKVWLGFLLFTTAASISLASATTPPIDPPSVFSKEEQDAFFAKHVDYPDIRTTKLLDGTSVGYPLLVLEVSMVQIIGTSDLDKMNEYLSRHNVEAAGPSVLWGKALVSLTAVDNRVTAIGPYKELIVGVYAKGTNSSGEKVTGFFIVQQYVTSKAALDYGVELWGMPKELARITVQPQSDGSRWFEVSELGGNALVEAVWSNTRSTSPSGTFKTGNFITPVPNQHFVPFASEYKNFRGNLFDPEHGDRVDIIQSISEPPMGFWTNLLSKAEAGFKPRYWQRGDMMAVFGSVDDPLPKEETWVGPLEY